MSNEEIARTILAQLGGNKFCAMTGVKNLGFGDRCLIFKIGKNCKQVNHVTVTLEGSDLYTMTFQWVTKKKNTVKAKYEGVFCDQLQELFTEATGMYTSL